MHNPVSEIGHGMELNVRNNAPSIWNGGVLATVLLLPSGDYGFYVFPTGLHGRRSSHDSSNSKFHDICLTTFRNNNNYAAGNDLLVLNNEWYNSGQLSDGNNFNPFNSGASITFRGNVVHDTRGGIGLGNNEQHVLIEDNIFFVPRTI